MQRTALYDAHKRAGAKLVDFAGWEMPVMYRGVAEEHVHTRKASSAFDVSHMGRLIIRGNKAEELLQHVCTRNVGKLAVGRSGYSHVCNATGGILDDVIVSRYESHWLMVCNASNRNKIVDHLTDQGKKRNIVLEDTTLDTVMIAIQGPATLDLFRKNVPIPIPEIKRYGFVASSYMGMPYTICRSGYTGEDGLEVILPASAGTLAWDYMIRDSGPEPRVKPAGLAARDTLRLEAAMPLYGHELNENTDPLSAGCKWCVDLEKDFLGVEALRRIAAEGPRRKIVGLVLEGRRIARQETKVYKGGDEVGEVTSGTLSPTLDQSIAMAYVNADYANEGTALEADLRGTRVPATVVPLPFYKRSS